MLNRLRPLFHCSTSSTFPLAIAACLILLASVLGRAQAPRTVQDGVYTDAQAARGQALFSKECVGCHGAELQGAQGPPLKGEGFLLIRQPESLWDLASKIRNTMPPGVQGAVNAAQAADLVAHILKAGGFKPGAAELASAEDGLTRIRWPQGSAVAQAAGTARTYPPLGNMAQLMRGIYFPNSNLIFTVQTGDPGAKPTTKVDASTQSNGFSWIDWGGSIYGGWELVDNAAIALADAAPLMLVPMRCENGRQAPVTDPDWIKYTEEMIAVSRRIYKLSQSRNQEAVSDATGDLSDSCAACHAAYRDVRGRGQGGFNTNDPSNKANRCQSRVK
jgi:mono/diheme cytochrome c family protein